MARLYMIRHGKPSSTWGQAGDPDPGLDAAGQAQASGAADALMGQPEALRPRRVFSSPLRRCRETAQPLAARLGVPVEIDPRFGEIPTPSGLAHEARSAWLKEAMQGRWADIRGDLDYGAWRDGVGAALGDAAAASNGAPAAVFSHFVAINAALSCATPSSEVGAGEVISHRPDHASICIFEAGEDGLALVERGAQAATEVL